MNINAQILGTIAIALWAYSLQKKEQYKILFFQSLSNCAYVIQYILLGTLGAAAMDFTSAIRTFLFYKKRKNNEEISKYYLIFFIILIIILGTLTYKNALSLIPITITIFYSISNWLKEANWIRIVVIITAFVWIYYNFTVGAYVGIIGNIFEIISGVIGLIRFSKKRQKTKDAI